MAAEVAPVTVVLWDADGVLQRVTGGGEESMRPAVAGRVEDEEGFLEAAYWAELPALAGEVSWLDVLPGLLERWGVADRYDDVVRGWLSIEPVEATHDLLRALREAGLRCYLATNQQTRRAKWMRGNLGYEETFDRQFYSCELGLAKPDPAYFAAILEELDVKASTVLFVDDTAVNIDGATSVGLHAELFRRHGGRAALEEILRSYVVLGR